MALVGFGDEEEFVMGAVGHVDVEEDAVGSCGAGVADSE